MNAWVKAGLMSLGISFAWMGTAQGAISPYITANGSTATAEVKVEEKSGPMVLSTFHQESTGMSIRAENLPLNLVQLPLHDQIWFETFNGSPIDVVGDDITITSITVPDLGTSLLDRVESLSILDENGVEIATSTKAERSGSADLRLKSARTTHLMAYTTTYTFTTGVNGEAVTLPCHSENHDKTYFLRFNPAGNYTGAINIPVFQNHDTLRTDADMTRLRVTDDLETAPYLEIAGTTTFDRVTAELTNAGTFSLKAILEKAQALHDEAHPEDTGHVIDNFHHLIVLRAQTSDVIVEVDTPLLEAEVVVASNTPKSTYTGNDVTTRAATLRFKKGFPFTGALSVRDISKNQDGSDMTTPAKGFVRFEYVNDEGTAELVIPSAVLSPFSFTQTCDVELASYPEKGTEVYPEEGDTTTVAVKHWFWRNPFKVPSGRALRLVTCTHGNLDKIPNVIFTDATSTLDLAFDSTTHTTHEMAEAVGKVIDSSSGTLELHSATSAAATRPGLDENGNTVQVDNIIYMGDEEGSIYGMPTEQTIRSYNDLTINNSFVIANGAGTMADIIQYAGTTTIGRSPVTNADNTTTTYNDVFRFGRGSPTDPTALGAARAVYELKDGELNVPGTLLFSNRVQVGRLTIGDGVGLAGSASATIGTLSATPTSVTENPGPGESIATSVTGLVTVEILRDGIMQLANDLDFTPPDKSFFYLEGGTLFSTKENATFTFGNDIALGGGIHLRGGNGVTSTIAGTGLTVDAVSGDGDLQLGGTVTIGELRDFRGKVECSTINGVAGTGTISKISGARSVITFGNLGENGTMGVANILTMAEASGFRGSLGFDASVYSEIDVESVPIETLGHAIRVEDGQELIIRLDQLADTIIAWPDQITKTTTLTLVEAGAYGGRLQLPHIPSGVTVNFKYYNDAGGLLDHTDGTWKLTPEENGATDILSWEEPHVGGKGTWIDIEFDGNSKNTGWLQLGAKNGALKGITTTASSYGRLLDEATIDEDTAFFTDTYNPAGRGVKLYVHPYLDTYNANNVNAWCLEYPEVWSAAIRMTPPNKAQKTVLAIGTLIHNAESDRQILVLATGASNNELILWHVTANDGTLGTEKLGEVSIPTAMKKVASAKIQYSDDIMHVVSVTCDGKQLIVYLDGRQLVQYELPDNFPGFGSGMQVGQLLDDNWNNSNIKALLTSVGEDDDGVVDYIRFYKGVLTPEAMTALSEESPAIDRATRYIRELTADGDWVVPDDSSTEADERPWTRETWIETTTDGTTTGAWVASTEKYAEPTEGAEVRVICHGNYTLKVNTVEKRDSGFLSRDRFYSLFTVTPPDSATANVTLTLVPVGGAITTKDQAEKSAWMNTKVDGDYLYGTLLFQGGAGDLVHPELAMVPYATNEHTFWLRGNTQTGTATNYTYGTPSNPDIETDGGEKDSWFGSSTWTETRTITQTRTETRQLATAGSAVANLTATAGILGFQEQTPIFIDSVGTTLQSRTATRTITQTRTTEGEFSRWNPPDESDYPDWKDYTAALEAAAWDPLPTSEEDWTTVKNTDGTVQQTLVPSVLTMQADYSLVRGATDKESVIHVLTGPVEGSGTVVGNSDVALSQVSQDVWVPKFTEGDEWHITDVTRTYYGTAEDNTGGKLNGLIAKVLQVPGRLYLDLTKQPLITDANGKAYFSKQNWYRYGYIGTTAAASESGVAAYPIYTNNADGTLTYTEAGNRDFDMAIAFQIKTATETKTLVLDATKPEVGTFRVDLPDSYETVPTLILENPSSNRFTITGQLITFARLEDLQGSLGIQEGTLIHGHTTGTYAFKDHTLSHLVKDSTVANLEVHGTATNFSGSVELHDTNLILAPGAIFHQSNPDGHLWMKSLTLGEGATFHFEARGADPEENGVVFLERVTLEGQTATLYGGGDVGSGASGNASKAAHFTAEGFTAEKENTILTMQSTRVNITPQAGATVADENAAQTDASNLNRWICYTADFQGTGFGLTKAGDGIMAFRDQNQPSLSGPVRVEAGILRVGGKAQSSDALLHDKHLTNAIGHHGLHVAAGATLEGNFYTPQDYVIACLEGGQKLSGTGTIDGNVRLCSGSIVNGKDGIGMTVRRFVLDGSDSSDVTVNLPDNVTRGATLFYLTDDSVRTETRRRFKALKGTARWDVVGEHKAATDTTSTWAARYYVEDPYLPLPSSPTSGVTSYDTTVESTLILYYQSYGVANLLETHGVTKAGTYRLNATELGNAFSLFSNVWTFAEPLNTNLVDMRHLLMAYEFGITRETIRNIEVTEGETTTTQPYVVIEVSLLNTLAERFASGYQPLEGARTLADFQLGTELVILNANDVALPISELMSFDSTNLTPPTVATRTPGKRYYAIPYVSENFPHGTTQLRVEARKASAN